MIDIDQILKWTAEHAEGKAHGTPGSVSVYAPDELHILATSAAACIHPPFSILEIGTYSGLSASVLLQIAWHYRVHTIMVDPFVWVPEYAIPTLEGMLEWFDPNSYTLEDRCSYMAARRHINHHFSFMHIDGEHTFAAVELDCRLWLPRLIPGGAVAFHDVNCPPVRSAIDHSEAGKWPVYMCGGINGIEVRRKPE